eukprot:scaffold630_cov188-Ochromonas_danica.AAC.11
MKFSECRFTRTAIIHPCGGKVQKCEQNEDSSPHHQLNPYPGGPWSIVSFNELKQSPSKEPKWLRLLFFRKDCSPCLARRCRTAVFLLRYIACPSQRSS